MCLCEFFCKYIYTYTLIHIHICISYKYPNTLILVCLSSISRFVVLSLFSLNSLTHCERTRDTAAVITTVTINTEYRKKESNRPHNNNSKVTKRYRERESETESNNHNNKNNILRERVTITEFVEVKSLTTLYTYLMGWVVIFLAIVL